MLRCVKMAVTLKKRENGKIMYYWLRVRALMLLNAREWKNNVLLNAGACARACTYQCKTILWTHTRMRQLSVRLTFPLSWRKIKFWGFNAITNSLFGKREKSYTAKQTWFRDLAVVLYNRYMINAQNFIQILHLVLSDGRLIRWNIR